MITPMKTNQPGRPKYIPIAECEICSQLEEVETSFYKYSWDDMTLLLPPAAARLEPAEDISSGEKKENHIKRCPVCGIFYEYSMSYEYFVNGSEDEEKLTRLTPTQARRFLTDEEYDRLIGIIQSSLDDPNILTRRYAAKCLVSHHLELGEMDAVRQYLSHPDREVALGALRFLLMLAERREKVKELTGLKDVIEGLEGCPDQEVSQKAGALLLWLKP